MASFRQEWPSIALTVLAALGVYLYARWDAKTSREAREKAVIEEQQKKEKAAAEERVRREKFHKKLFPGRFGGMPQFLPVEVVMKLQKEKALARWRKRGRK